MVKYQNVAPSLPSADLFKMSLPSLINVVHHKCAEDEQNEESNKHVVDGPDMIHFK